MHPAPLALPLLALALLTCPAAAQPAKPIVIDGKLTRDDPFDRFRKQSHHKIHEVELEAGTAYLIDLVSRDLDTFLRLEDEKGRVLSENDDLSKGDRNSRIGFLPPRAGKYRLVVTSSAGGAVGAYRLEVRPQPVAVPDAPPLLVYGRLATTDPRDPVRKQAPHRRHEVPLEQGKIYLLTLRSVEFDAFLRLEDERGKALAEDDDGGGLRDAQILFVAPRTGTYRAVATGFDKGASGWYCLTAARYADAVAARTRQAQERSALSLLVDGAEQGQRGQLAPATATFGQAVALARQLYPEARYPQGHPLLAIGLTNQGGVFHEQRQFDAARRCHEEALALRRKGLPPDHPDLALSLHYLGQTLADLGQSGAAVRCHEEAVAIRRKALPAGHADLAVSLTNLGDVLVDQGKPDAARRCHEEALALRQKTLPARHPDIAWSLSSLGLALDALGRPEEARARHEEALAIWKKVLPPGHQHLATGLNNLGEALADLGRLDEARRCHEEALAIRRKLPPNHPHLALTLGNLGVVLRAEGKLDEARRCHEEALAVRRKALPAAHPHLAQSLTNLGGVLQQQGRLAEARQCQAEAVRVFREALPADHPHLANALSNLGAVLLHQGALAEGRAALEESLAILKRGLPPGHADLATGLSNLGVASLAQGKLDEARDLFGEALAIMRKALPPGRPELATGLTNLGTALRDQGKADEARRHYEEALALRKKVLPPEHPQLVTSFTDLGVLLAARGDHLGAWANLTAAAETSAAHVAAVAAGSPQADHGPLQRLHSGQFDRLVSAAALLKPGVAVAAGRELLGAVLASKGISTSLLGHRQRTLLHGADEAARADFDRLLGLRRQLANSLLQGRGRRTAEQYRKDCDDLRRRADDLERDLAGRVKALGDWRKAHRAPAEEVAARLGDNAVLIEILRYQRYDFTAPRTRPWREQRYAAVLVWRGADGGPQVRFVPLGEAGPIKEAVATWRRKVQAGRTDARAEEVLRRLVWDPLARVLPAKTDRLVIAPDGQLALVPLEALRLEGGKYLVERYRVNYAGSGRDLIPGPVPDKRLDAALLLADPAYDAVEGGAAAPGAGVRDADLRFKSLPGFAREADAAAKLLAGRAGWRVERLHRQAASEERLAKAARPRLLYCITHGFFLKDVETSGRGSEIHRDLELVGISGGLPHFGEDPRLRSGLALAGANKWRERSAKGLSDGLLTALEVENLDLWGTELVVLSACETGLGEVQVGEGVLGLRRAFQLAGAHTVLASLWKVPDTETEQLMTDTLQRWLKGAPPHEALRAAQLEMIRRLREAGARNSKPGEAPPLYWAGFICHGRAD
jgi:CHAT domain-containing protein/tetratricopeptide (TPR) repeat protein